MRLKNLLSRGEQDCAGLWVHYPAGRVAEEHEQFADGAVDQLPFTDLVLTEGNEGNEEGGRPTYLVAVGIAAVGHASVTVLGRSGHFLELGSAKRDCVWPRRRGERGFCGRRLFDGVFPCPLGLFGRKGPELGLVVGLAMVAICGSSGIFREILIEQNRA